MQRWWGTSCRRARGHAQRGRREGDGGGANWRFSDPAQPRRDADLRPRTPCTRRGRLLLIASLALILSSGPALAQQGVPPVWSPNGPVYAIAVSDHTVYIGGKFDGVGPFTGAGAPVDTATSAVIEPFPFV